MKDRTIIIKHFDPVALLAIKPGRALPASLIDRPAWLMDPPPNEPRFGVCKHCGAEGIVSMSQLIFGADGLRVEGTLRGDPPRHFTIRDKAEGKAP